MFSVLKIQIKSVILFIAENIWKLVKSVLEDWEVYLLVMIVLRDGAQNMIAAFNLPGCFMEALSCFIHTNQLVILHELFTMPSVKKMITSVKQVVSHAQLSNVFCAELWR